MQPQDMLRVSNALVKTIRHYVPVSQNLKATFDAQNDVLSNKYRDTTNETIRKNISPHRSSKYYCNHDYIRERNAKRALMHKLGNCYELVNIGITLLKMTNIPDTQNWQALILSNDSHELLFFTKEKKIPPLPFMDLDGIWGMPAPKIPSGIICDPWLIASIISNKDGCETIIKKTKKLRVKRFYITPFSKPNQLPNYFLKQISCYLSERHQINNYYAEKKIFKNLCCTFSKFYEEEKMTSPPVPYMGAFSKLKKTPVPFYENNF